MDTVQEAEPVTELQKQFQYRVTEWRKLIAIAGSPDAKLIQFQDAAYDLAAFADEGIPKPEINDALMEMGRAHNLGDDDDLTLYLSDAHRLREWQPKRHEFLEERQPGAKAWREANNRQGGAAIAPLPLTFYGECAKPVPKRHLIKGVMARGETSSWIAPPKAGKSALINDMFVYLGAGINWRGYRTKEKTGSVIFAFERSDLTKRRLSAYVARGFIDLPIAVAGKIIDLMNPTSTEIICATIKAAEDHFGCGVGAIAIDTYAKGIAAGGGDEDKARDQTKVLTNMRRVQERFDLHVALVNHTGKDETRGARGSNAHLADVDVMVQIRNLGTIKEAEIVNANDGPDGPLTTFKLELAKLGKDDDGDDIETAIVAVEQFGRSRSAPDEPKLNKNERTLFTILYDAGPAGLTTEEWNEKARQAEIGIKRRADLYDFRISLRAKGRVYETSNGRWNVRS